MVKWNEKLNEVQEIIQKNDWDGWLLYDFRKSNELACDFLEIPKDTLLTRRFFYWIPKTGQPIKIVHRIESHVLKHLPGAVHSYSSYEELETALSDTLKGSSTIAMEYSPRNAIPTVSKVDAGTIDLIRSLGVTVKSSADILQAYTCVWSPEQFKMHQEAAKVLQMSVEKAWEKIARSIRNHENITEVDVQRLIQQEMMAHQCHADDPPICAVNANSANPHYSPNDQTACVIRKGDFVLIDVWCKKTTLKAVYADITRVAVVADSPTKRQQVIFDVVKAGRDAAINFIKKRLVAGEVLRGWEVDEVCRSTIEKAGYGKYFTHRTGHNIGERDHGDGANIDNFETKDQRLLLPGTCFSIEPGVYLPGEFGVRLEDDVYLDLDGKTMHVTPGLQEEIFCLLS